MICMQICECLLHHIGMDAIDGYPLISHYFFVGGSSFVFFSADGGGEQHQQETMMLNEMWMSFVLMLVNEIGRGRRVKKGVVFR